ncbi:MAG: thioredoxin [Deltaproteobacteria bacterium HGW-Deltaproteobacteria-14]|jgi:thioredoxin 1|nr:MAG: thioredoxin [Deltaproteobacteria bacterium HGW-Deltaproteobacteria-14]
MTLKSGIIISLTALGIVIALAYRGAQSSADEAAPPASHEGVAVASAPTSPAPAPAPRALPRLVELGSDSCASCKAMMPVLAELRRAHPDTLKVDFIDVWKHPDDAEPFKVRIIPTQVFLAPDGRELDRHQGFYPADAIRERFRTLGFPVAPPAEG